MKTIYTYLRLLALTCALAIGLNSCKEEEGPNTPSDSAEVIFEVPRLELSCDGEEASVAFGIVNPVENAELVPSVDVDWIHDFKVKKNSIEFIVDKNPDAENREATVNVAYADSKSSFVVFQQSYETPFRLEVVEESITETSARFRAFPKDGQMPYLLSSIEASYKDMLGDDDVVFDMILTNFQETASAMNLSLSDFLKLNNLILVGNTSENGEISRGHKPDTDYYAFAVGMTYDGKRTSDIVYVPFHTKPVTGVDQTFDISVTVNGLSATLDVTSSKKDNYFLYGCIADSQLKKEGVTLEQKISKLMADNVSYGYLFGLTSDEVVKSQCVLGHDQKTVDGLDGDALYWAYAVGVSLSGQLNSELASKSFTSGSVPQSDNVITVNADNVGVDNVHMVVTTTNKDPYALLIEPASKFEGKSDSEILNELLKYDLSHSMKEGNFSGTARNLTPGSDYFIFCFGYLGGQANTPLSKCRFTTVDAGDPDSFQFRTEATDLTVRSARVTAYGTPETLLYYWDAVPVGTTDEEIIYGINMTVQSLIHDGTIQTPLEYFRAVGSRGTATYEFKGLNATTEYVPIAVPVDEILGNHTGKVFRGKSFTTKSQKLSDATVKVTFDKYWDGDEIAANFLGYEEFGGQNLYCVPLKVETTGSIRDTYFSIYSEDLTDEQTFDDEFWINELYTKNNGSMRRDIQYFLPYDSDCTIVAVAIDTDGNFTKVFRTVINKSKAGVSDISEFKPFHQESTSAVPMNTSFKKKARPVYNSGKNLFKK